MNRTAMNFRTRRERLSLTQAELATRLGVNSMTVSRWERGVRKVRFAVELALRALERERKRKQSTIDGDELPEFFGRSGPLRGRTAEMKRSNKQITREFLDQQIAIAESESAERRRQLSEAQKKTNVADERLHALRSAKQILFGDERKDR